MFSALVGEILEESESEEGGRPTHAIDVGSGRAHLSRALTHPPLFLHVLAVDWSATQTSGAEYLNTLKSRGPSSSSAQGQGQGSLTHQTSTLDAKAISQLMSRWPPSPEKPEEKEQPPALLLALHACGDLTLSALTAFLTPTPSPSNCKRKAVLVGCCYNLQTPSLFPLSSTFDAHSPPPLTRAHLLLTAQSPLTWFSPLTPSSPLPPGDALRKSVRKLAYRARLEAELLASGLVEAKGVGERRVGRVGECSSWSEYRARALARYGAEEVQELAFGEAQGQGEEEEEREWEEVLWKLQVFWTLRSWVGPVVESLLVLDRWCALVEGMGEGGEWEAALEGEGEGEGEAGEPGGEKGQGSEGDTGSRGKARRVDLVNLFDQRTGSLRNLALVVR
ncbi:hypothetical protein BCR35DRAFT_329971 [Leucosporidium creatinivorum]|uniref:Methyltransferase domain-containing protein n=1 Tax=Leucosporidium creatinivorum TaxID=106004 RepID=A0A1Y2FY13_9BASI|nr:hypothetical protein BCR35DRAFT_329971 [Leucosporidium creatinivorum]